MSEVAQSGEVYSAEHPPQEPDTVNTAVIRWTALLVIATTLLASSVAWLMIRARFHAVAPRGFEAARGGALPSLINQIETHNFGEAPLPARSAALERLERYGWVDAEHQRVHVPIERAIGLYLAGVRASEPPAENDPYRRAQPETAR